jgi:hypothetical protein
LGGCEPKAMTKRPHEEEPADRLSGMIEHVHS